VEIIQVLSKKNLKIIAETFKANFPFNEMHQFNNYYNVFLIFLL
jgi:hypothetical protein